jgi:PEP-CTERM motif
VVGNVASQLTVNPRVDHHDLIFTTSSSPGDIPVTPNVVFPIEEVSQLSLLAQSDIPFSVDAGLTLNGEGGASFDFLSTAQLSFDLPPGATVTSDSGFFQAGPAVGTPEPASLTLASLGVMGLVGYGWRRRMSAAGQRPKTHRTPIPC